MCLKKLLFRVKTSEVKSTLCQKSRLKNKFFIYIPHFMEIQSSYMNAHSTHTQIHIIFPILGAALIYCHYVAQSVLIRGHKIVLL